MTPETDRDTVTEMEAEADWADEWDDADSAAHHARVEAGEGTGDGR